MNGERGAALPMAAFSLAIVSTLVGGLAMLSGQEPAIAANQLRVGQARALAEAGVERAVWALNNAADDRGIPLAFAAAPAPYDGSQLVMVAPASGDPIGGFRVTVENGAAAYERNIVAVGWVPNDTTSGRRAVQKITVVALNPRLILRDPPAAVSVRGSLSVGGTAVVDARADRTCGRRTGILSVGSTALLGASTDVRGATSGDDSRNRVTDAAGGPIPPSAADVVMNASASVFDEFAPNDRDIDALRGGAEARGTYLRGSVTFDEQRRLPNGLVFIDSASGSTIPAGLLSPSAAADLATVDVRDGAIADPTGVWSGWLVVNGSVVISGTVQMKGWIHARDSFSYQGAGRISGTVVGQHLRDGSASVIDPASAGSAAIVYNCSDARSGGGAIPGRWTVKRGSYREVSGT